MSATIRLPIRLAIGPQELAEIGTVDLPMDQTMAPWAPAFREACATTLRALADRIEDGAEIGDNSG